MTSIPPILIAISSLPVSKYEIHMVSSVPIIRQEKVFNKDTLLSSSRFKPIESIIMIKISDKYKPLPYRFTRVLMFLYIIFL